MGENRLNYAADITSKMLKLKPVVMVWKKFILSIEALKKNVMRLRGGIPKPESGPNLDSMKIIAAPNQILITPGERVVIAPPVLFIKKMGDLMIMKHGVGLSANQVGINQTFFVANFEHKFTVCINPKIIQHGNQILETPEGCLSILDQRGRFIYKMKKLFSLAIIRLSRIRSETFST